jgi:hypothetical protein
MKKRNRNIKNIFIMLQMGTNIMANQVKTPIQNYFEKVLYENQCFTEFPVSGNVFHHVYMSVRGRMPTCDLIGRLFLGSGLQRMF